MRRRWSPATRPDADILATRCSRDLDARGRRRDVAACSARAARTSRSIASAIAADDASGQRALGRDATRSRRPGAGSTTASTRRSRFATAASCGTRTASTSGAGRGRRSGRRALLLGWLPLVQRGDAPRRRRARSTPGGRKDAPARRRPLIAARRSPARPRCLSDPPPSIDTPLPPEPPFAHDRAPRVGVLLVNLGTPDAPTPAGGAPLPRASSSSDPRVVEIPRRALAARSCTA